MAAPPAKLDDLLTIDQLADRYDLDRATLQNWRWLGKGPRGIKVGRNVMYPVAEVARWEASRTRVRLA